MHLYTPHGQARRRNVVVAETLHSKYSAQKNKITVYMAWYLFPLVL